MNVVFEHWSYDPFLLIVAMVLVIHGRGLSKRLAAIEHAGRPVRPWVGQAVLFWTGLLVLVLAVVSPIDYWSSTYLTAHIVQHILLAFVAPPLIVLGAPWLPLLRGLPSPVIRWYGHLLQRTRGGAGGARRRWPAAAAVRRFAARPVTAVVAFNIAMVFWHLPGPFDLAERNDTIHIWLAHGSFFGLGVALWLQIYGSYPFRPVLAPPGRVVALVSTNAVMVLIAMSLVMFSHDAYPWYSSVLSASTQNADQQIAGAILWVCGEVTFLPSILWTIARWLDDAEHPPRLRRQPATAR